MKNEPSPAGPNGRRPDGRFDCGNKAGRGNPHARKVQKLRSTLLRSVKTDDLREIVESLIALAKRGDVAAAREVLDRCLGKSRQAVEVDAKQTFTNSPPVDPAVVDVRFQRWIADTIAKQGQLPYPIVDAKLDQNYMAFLHETALAEDTLPPPIGERIEVLFREDFYGSKTANDAARNELN